MNYRYSTYYMPLYIVVWFNAVTFLLYLSDIMIEYPDKNRVLLVSFMSGVMLLVLWGYYLGLRFGSHNYSLNFRQKRARWFDKLTNFGFFSAVFLFPFSIYAYTGQDLSAFFGLLLNPVDAYAAMTSTASEAREERLGFLLISMILSPLTVIALPMHLYSYFLYKRKKAQTIILILMSLIMSVFRGTDKEFFDIFIIAFAVYIVVQAIKNKIAFSGLFGRKLIVILIVFGILFSVFSFRKSERLAGVDYYCLKGTDICHDLSFDGEVTPASLGFIMIYRYISHGYGGLEASFDTSFEFGYGVGHSKPLTYILSIIDPTLQSHGVVAQLDEVGWSSTGIWSTGYVWLANDVPLFLVPLIMFLLAFMLARTWKETIKSANPLSLILFVYLFYTFIYMPLNLQIAQVGIYYVGLIFWVFVYVAGNMAVMLRSFKSVPSAFLLKDDRIQ